MKILEVKQGSEEWFRARAGIPTASEFRALITSRWTPTTGSAVQTYLYKKVAERWRGAPLGGSSSWAMEQGSLLQEKALPSYVLATGRKIKTVGFITTDDGRVGCSPDGMFADGTGIEAKCPEPQTHVKYLLAGKVPTAYLPQIQGSMFVTGAPRWVFMSYCRKFPPLVLTVERDPVAMEALAAVLAKFNERLDAAYARLVALASGSAPDPAEDDDNVLPF